MHRSHLGMSQWHVNDGLNYWRDNDDDNYRPTTLEIIGLISAIMMMSITMLMKTMMTTTITALDKIMKLKW